MCLTYPVPRGFTPPDGSRPCSDPGLTPLLRAYIPRFPQDFFVSSHSSPRLSHSPSALQATDFGTPLITDTVYDVLETPTHIRRGLSACAHPSWSRTVLRAASPARTHTTFDMTLIATRLSTGPRLYSTKRGPGEYISASMLPRFLMGVQSPSPHARPTVHQVIASYTLRPSVYACPSQPLYPCATTYISSPDLYIP